MKVTVKDNYLNVRVGKPSVNAPCYQYLAPGSEIDVNGQLYKGDLYNNIDTWFKDEGGNYYWSGGVNTDTFSKDTNIQPFIDSAYDGKNLKYAVTYDELIDTPEDIKSTAGESVTIGVLDHPISMSINVQNNILRPFHIGDPLFNFHANFITGLIGGIRNIIGVSNKVKILELPIFNQRASSSGIDVNAVLKYVNTYETPLIINVSNELDSSYNDIISKFNKDKIVIACAGIDTDLSAAAIRNPASLSNVIAVGAVSKLPSLLAPLNPKIDFVVPNYNYLSYEKDCGSFTKGQGDSFSCAVVSAVTASLISSGKATFDIDSIKQGLQDISAPFSNDSSLNSFNIINTKA